MRPFLAAMLVVVLPVMAAAQLPRDLSGLARQVPSLNSWVRGAPLVGFVHAAFRLPGRAFEMMQGGYDRWAERAEQAQDVYDRYDFYRERAERATDAPSEDAVDELEDTDHYRDGIDAATSGDPGDRLVWIIDHHERETGALEWAIAVLEGLPTTSTTDDGPAWEPGGGVAVPSRGGQTLGISGR